MKRILIILSVIVLSASCVKESFPQARDGNKRTIGVNVSGCNDLTTRAASEEGEFFGSSVMDTIGSQVLMIDGYVSDAFPQDCGVETKGTIISTSSIDEFWMTSYGNGDWHDNETATDYSAGTKYFEAKAVTKSGDVWSIDSAPTWINDVDMTFWCVGGLASAPGLEPVDNDLTDDMAMISYTSNGTSDLLYAYNLEKRTFDRKGTITGGSGTYKTAAKSAMDIKFYHALSAVRFDVSPLKKEEMTIKSIKFLGVVNKADCEITVGTATTGSPFPLSFYWTPKSGSSNKADFTVALASTDFTETADGVANALMPMSSSKFLFLIPQEVQGQGITVELKYENAGGAELTTTASLNHATPWEAGKYYTYRLKCESVDLLTGDIGPYEPDWF